MNLSKIKIKISLKTGKNFMIILNMMMIKMIFKNIKMNNNKKHKFKNIEIYVKIVKI